MSWTPGFDINHPDISPNKHPSLHWDLVDDDNDPSEVPPSNHGTRVGGVISARSNNGIGLAGYAGGWQGVQGCSVVGLRVGGYNPESGLDEITQERAAAALDYAGQNGIKVINMSFNFYQRTDAELSIFKAAVDGANGIVVMVAASGNGFKNTDEVHPNDPLPAPARWNGVIAVGAATSGSSPSAELRWTGSNYDAIDEKLSVVTSVGEPGGSPGNLQTTVQGGTYGTVARTSGAAPQVRLWQHCFCRSTKVSLLRK